MSDLSNAPEAGPEESESHYRMLFENSPISIWEEDFSAVKALFERWRQDGVRDIEAYFEQHPEAVRQCADRVRVVDVNRATLNLHGANGKEPLLAGLVNTFTPESFDTFRRELICLWRGETEMAGDAVVKTLDGELRYVTVNFAVCPGYEETLSRVFVSLTDITERKRMEQDLTTRERDFRTLVENSPDPILRYDRDCNRIYINPVVEQISGIPSEPLLGSKPSDGQLLRESEADKLMTGIRQAFASDQSGHVEFEFIDLHGDRHVYDMLLIPEHGLDGRVESVLGIGRDIIERKRAEMMLAESEQQFRSLAENSPDNIIRYDRQCRAVYCNPMMSQTLGVSTDVFLGKTPEEFGAGSLESDTEYEGHVRRALQSGESSDMELIILHPDGGLRTHLVRFAAERDMQGNIVGVLAIGRDITGLKLIEDALYFVAQHGWPESERPFFDALARFLGERLDMDYVLIGRLDDDTDIAETIALYANGTIAPNMRYALKGTPCEKLMGRQLCVYPEGVQRQFPEDTLLVEMGVESYLGIQLKNSIGRPIGLIALLGCKALAEDTLAAQVLQLVATRAAAELERERSDRILRAREYEFRSLAENLPDNIIRYDRQGVARYVNPTLEKTLGISARNLIGSRVGELFPDGSYAWYEKAVSAALSSGKNNEIEFVLPNKDKEQSIHQIRFIVERDEQREVSGLLAIGRDITEHKMAEAVLLRHQEQLEETVELRTTELRQARDVAEAASKAKSHFLANMSHELRTPLNAILGFSHMMRQDADLSDVQYQNLDIINQSGEHLLKLINDVLDLAKIESGKLQLNISTFDLQGMVHDVTEMMRLRAQQKGLQLQLDQSSEFPRYIKGDEARLRQILLNLVGNAVKFTRQGGVTIRLGVRENAQHHLRIEVEDSGPGINAEDQQVLFRPFVQLPEGASHGGTGLGLSIVRQFVQLMGGAITLESTPGKGSLFRVELPLEMAGEQEIAHLGKTLHGEVTGLAPGQAAYRILIAEDQIDNQLLLATLMGDLGLEAKIASNGEECVQLFREWRPDLIWMDWRMPVMDGVEATRRIRDLPDGDKVKIIAVTASAFMEQQSELRTAGMDDYVRKPFRSSEIHDCMARVLGIQFTYRENQPVESDIHAPQITQRLSVIAVEMRDELRAAIESLDRERIDLAIGCIADNDRELGRYLSRLAEEFDYPSILLAL